MVKECMNTALVCMQAGSCTRHVLVCWLSLTAALFHLVFLSEEIVQKQTRNWHHAQVLPRRMNHIGKICVFQTSIPAELTAFYWILRQREQIIVGILVSDPSAQQQALLDSSCLSK